MHITLSTTKFKHNHPSLWYHRSECLVLTIKPLSCPRIRNHCTPIPCHNYSTPAVFIPSPAHLTLAEGVEGIAKVNDRAKGGGDITCHYSSTFVYRLPLHSCIPPTPFKSSSDRLHLSITWWANAPPDEFGNIRRDQRNGANRTHSPHKRPIKHQ